MIIATADEIIESTFNKSNQLGSYLGFEDYRRDGFVSKETLKEYGISYSAPTNWARGAIPYATQFMDWATEKDFFSEGSSRTGWVLASDTPRLPLLERITNLTWTTGNLRENYHLTLSGAKDSLEELCEDINSQINTDFNVIKQKDVNAHSIEMGYNLGRLVWPLLGFTGNKADNLEDIPYLARTSKSCARRFIRTLNDAKGYIQKDDRCMNDRFTFMLPAKRTREQSELLSKKVNDLVESVAGMRLNVSTYEHKEDRDAVNSQLYTPMGKSAEYLDRCNLKI